MRAIRALGGLRSGAAVYDSVQKQSLTLRCIVESSDRNASRESSWRSSRVGISTDMGSGVFCLHASLNHASE